MATDLIQQERALKALCPALELADGLTDVHWHTQVADVLAYEVLDQGPDVQLLSGFCRLWQLLPSFGSLSQVRAEPVCVPL